jgi:protein farnesyltransferase subunit beta
MSLRLPKVLLSKFVCLRKQFVICISLYLLACCNRLLLERAEHSSFLVEHLRGLPSGYTMLDASRPWLLYWILHSLALLNIKVDPKTRRRTVDTLFRCSPTPSAPTGFGGGPQQMPHLAPTYASVMALAYVGDAEDWAKIDRAGLLQWLLSLKQPDGSFIMHKGGEVDVRGCYCALSVAYLLGIATPELVRGTREFIVKSVFCFISLSSPNGEAD